MTTPSGTREQTISDYLAVVRRYKWVILVAVLVVPTVAYFMSARSRRSSRQGRRAAEPAGLGATITGLPTQSTVQDPERYARTQARLAACASAPRDRRAGERRRVGIRRPGRPRYRHPHVRRQPRRPRSRDGARNRLCEGLHRVSGRTRQPSRAPAGAPGPARRSSGTQAHPRATRIGSLSDRNRISGRSRSCSSRQLRHQHRRWRHADRPLPRRNAILGAMLGLLLGIGGAFALNAFDRQADEVEHELQIRSSRSCLRRGVETLPRSSSGPDETTEAVARLRASFDFTNQQLGAKTVMVTSAGPREGKSTTIANHRPGAHRPPRRAGRPRPRRPMLAASSICPTAPASPTSPPATRSSWTCSSPSA